MNENLEIERKFLVNSDKLKNLKYDKIVQIMQGYLLKNDNTLLRIRKLDKKYVLTIKIKTLNPLERIEIEKDLTKSEFKTLWKQIPDSQKIIKIRKIIFNPDKTKWEIDFFQNLKNGYENLILAEIELPNKNYKFSKPIWLGKEVTSNQKYYNENLIKYTDEENISEEKTSPVFLSNY